MLICYDIGGTRIRAGLASGSGSIELIGAWPNPVNDPDALLEVMAEAARPHRRSLGGASVAIAGVIDPVSGRMRASNIPGLYDVVAAERMERALGLPVTIANDADCFALAEARTGAGRGHRNVFGIILGTGIGGGLIIDGRIVQGAGGYAGEWGHGPVIRSRLEGEEKEIPAVRCGCGQIGCLDTLGARGVERLDAFLNGVTRTTEEVFADWNAGGAMGRRTVSAWMDLLSGPLAMVLNVTGSSVVPVGGGMSKAPGVVETLDLAVRDRLLRQSSEPILRRAEHQGEPGLIGAAIHGFQELGPV